jgi:hypothetical protein
MHRQLIGFDFSVLCQLLRFLVGCNVRCICADALCVPQTRSRHMRQLRGLHLVSGTRRRSEHARCSEQHVVQVYCQVRVIQCRATVHIAACACVLTCASLRMPDRSSALRDIVTLAMGPSVLSL